MVYQSTAQGTRKVNHLFKADFFGERALLCDEPRWARQLCSVFAFTLSTMLFTLLVSLGSSYRTGCIFKVRAMSIKCCEVSWLARPSI